MNLQELHSYLGELLSAGVSPDIKVAALVDNWPHELREGAVMEGSYLGDPAPKMSAFTYAIGEFLLLEPMCQDLGDLVNGGTHRRVPPPSSRCH